MSEARDGGMAFPRGPGPASDGMSLRDWFAGHASEGDIASHRGVGPGSKPIYSREMAKYRYADAMLAAREKEAKP